MKLSERIKNLCSKVLVAVEGLKPGVMGCQQWFRDLRDYVLYRGGRVIGGLHVRQSQLPGRRMLWTCSSCLDEQNRMGLKTL